MATQARGPGADGKTPAPCPDELHLILDRTAVTASQDNHRASAIPGTSDGQDAWRERHVIHLDHNEPELGYHRLVAELAVEATPNGGAIADVGCGPGQVLGLMARWRPDVELWGVDGDIECVRRSKLRAPNAVVVQGDIVNPVLLPADGPARGFDVVTSSHALEHLHDPVGALSRWRDVLAPGGRLVVAVPNALQPILLARALARKPKANSGHYFIWDRATFDNFCRLAGFKVVDRRVDYVPLVPYRLRRRFSAVERVERSLLKPFPLFANSHIVVLEPFSG